MQATIPQPTSNYWHYRQAVQRAIQQTPDQWTFKSDPGYREVLEHVTPAQGIVLLEWARGQLLQLKWSQIEALATLNDSVGQPLIMSHLRYSPSNWRYLCHALKVWRHIESLNLPEVDIVELGGGYGGLALYVRGLAREFKTRVRTYIIVDLPEVAELQQRVANAVNVDLVAVSGLDANCLATMRPHDLTPRILVSAYAFSEFDQDTRDWYAERLVSYCDHGLMIWNFPEALMLEDGQWYGGPIYPFIDRELTVRSDEPALYAGHQVVTW